MKRELFADGGCDLLMLTEEGGKGCDKVKL